MSKKILARVLETANIDPNVRAQDDFYRHVNGRWIATHEIPADRPIDGAFHALRDLSEERGRDICNDAVAGTLDDTDATLIATLWGAFMDENAIEEAGITPLFPFFEAIDHATTREELDELTGTLMSGGADSFFGAYSGTHPHDSDARIMTFVQGGIGLPDEAYYREDSYAPIRDAYVSHLEKLASLASIGESSARVARMIMDLETRFASHHRSAVDNRNPLLSDNQMAWHEFVASAPGFNWDAWARGLGWQIGDEAQISVSQPDFFAGSAQIWGQTPIEDLKIWSKLSVLDARIGLLSSEFVEENFDFYGRTLSGTQELRPRWKRALGLVESVAGESLGRIWVSRHFPPQSKERMDQLVEGLLNAYGEAITACDWMGEETKKRALEKLATFRPKIGYPPKWRDMSGLVIEQSDSLVDAVTKAYQFETARELRKLDEPVDRDEWLMTPQTVNAYYHPAMNEIVFPAAILQPPFFDPEADDAVNFGAIGAVIGHEIGHGFDDQGSRYDAQGNLENWWSDIDRELFEQITGKLVEQYDELTPLDLAQPAVYDLDAGEDAQVEEESSPVPTVNGALTLGENIGDLAGLTIAWNAWVATLSKQGLSIDSAPVIDGLSGAQRFFYAWARAWRTASRPEFALQMLAIDPHSPAEFRCNQIARNMDQFHEAFNVCQGDHMWLDPSQRVHIW